jgi:hypothetical protein
MAMTDRRVFLATLAAALFAPAIATARRVPTRPGAPMPRRPPRPRPEPPPRPADRASWKKQLAASREQQIERLRAYRRAGKFPRNRLVEKQRVPIFVDDQGTPCAVASLMIEDGRRADVLAIARANNLVRVMEVHEGPLVDWLLRSGLLQEEAALIQPSYDWVERPVPRPPERQPPVAPDVMVGLERDEILRIQAHLGSVVKQLVANTDEALETALGRLLGAGAHPA